jgi:hypothetical protein
MSTTEMTKADKQPLDPRLDVYLEPLPSWQRTLGEELREPIHSVDSEIEERIKRRVQPCFVVEGTSAPSSPRRPI